MAVSAILSLVALCASFHVAHAAAGVNQRKSMEVDQEAILDSRGSVHHVSGAKPIMRAGKSSVELSASADTKDITDEEEHHAPASKNQVEVGHDGQAREPHTDPHRIAEVDEYKAHAHPGFDHQFDHAQELAKAKDDNYHQIHHGFDPNGELAELDSESEFIPGLSNGADLANRVVDIMMGVAGVIPEDYPFVCICLDTGKCDEPMPEAKKTPCPGRIGQKSAAIRSPLGIVAALIALGASLCA